MPQNGELYSMLAVVKTLKGNDKAYPMHITRFITDLGSRVYPGLDSIHFLSGQSTATVRSLLQTKYCPTCHFIAGPIPCNYFRR